jgi:hypothetical protein
MSRIADIATGAVAVLQTLSRITVRYGAAVFHADVAALYRWVANAVAAALVTFGATRRRRIVVVEVFLREPAFVIAGCRRHTAQVIANVIGVPR